METEMNIQNQAITEETLAWLLEESDPGVRYLAMRDLLALPADDASFLATRKAAHSQGPIATVLDNMEAEGYWVKPGPGYSPKYRSIVWSLILLGQLGASAAVDPRIETACRYYLDNAVTDHGQISSSRGPGGTMDCLQGNMIAALLDLGFWDARLEKAFEWMARTITGEGVAPMGTEGTPTRFYSSKVGPDFQCAANNKLACAWGGVKVMLAFSKLSAGQRTPLIEGAIERGVRFLFSVDPAEAAYPSGYADQPSSNWWKFGFPVFYVADVLQNVEALVGLGYGRDPRLANAIKLVRKKQDADGRWLQEYSYPGKTWVDFGKKKQPSKWVTLRAARVLEKIGARA